MYVYERESALISEAENLGRGRCDSEERRDAGVEDADFLRGN